MEGVSQWIGKSCILVANSKGMGMFNLYKTKFDIFYEFLSIY